MVATTKCLELWPPTREAMQVLAGSASFLLPALAVGAVGGICALANCLPGEVSRLHALHREGSMEEALELQVRGG